MSPGWEAWANWGLFFLRLGLGLIFLTHGYPKTTGVKSGAKASREGLADSIRRLGLPFPVQFAIVIGTGSPDFEDDIRDAARDPPPHLSE